VSVEPSSGERCVTPIERTRALDHHWEIWADGYLPPNAAEAHAAHASNSSVCAFGLWRSSRACQYGAKARGAGVGGQALARDLPATLPTPRANALARHTWRIFRRPRRRPSRRSIRISGCRLEREDSTIVTEPLVTTVNLHEIMPAWHSESWYPQFHSSSSWGQRSATKVRGQRLSRSTSSVVRVPSDVRITTRWLIEWRFDFLRPRGPAVPWPIGYPSRSHAHPRGTWPPSRHRGYAVGVRNLVDDSEIVLAWPRRSY